MFCCCSWRVTLCYVMACYVTLWGVSDSCFVPVPGVLLYVMLWRGMLRYGVLFCYVSDYVPRLFVECCVPLCCVAVREWFKVLAVYLVWCVSVCCAVV